jgi:beta-galactosidase/beta-glucuronidase
MNVRRVTFLVVIAWSLPVCADWQPAQGRLMTRWAKEVSPDNVHPEYPRPQMVRDQWASLNGLWQYAITPTQASGGGEAAEYAHAPKDWQGEILVPFPVESALSGVMKTVGEDNRLWYRRTFTIPNNWSGKRVLLHFGAVDWDAAVWVNGKEAGRHRGGYDPFSFDVTDALKPGAENELVVSVWDPSDKGFQPRGKQVDRPRGIWYTPVTGIWQTVWLEPVARTYVASLSIVPDLAGGMVRMIVNRAGEDRPLPAVVTVRSVSAGEVSHAFDDRKTTASVRPGETAVITLPEVHGWSPAEPWLYQFSVTLMDGTDRAFDTLRGYFALRDIAVTKDAAGVNRLFLNGEPLFQYGPLDQGWWPDGLYTAPTDEALRYDIEMTKKLGFNMCRKHVKVEPARWYYWCDKLGLMVWQDMPNGDRHIRERDPDITRTAESEENYRREWQAIMGALRNVPSIVAWVPFNVGWGQF